MEKDYFNYENESNFRNEYFYGTFLNEDNIYSEEE